MQTIKTLVTCAGGTTAIGVSKCLIDKQDIEIIGTDIRQESAGKIYCKKLHIVPSIYDVTYIEAIRSIVLEDNIDVIFPTMHDEISLFYNNDVNTFVALPDSKFVDCLLDKSKLYEELNSDYPQIIPQYVVYRDNRELFDIYKNYFQDKDCFCVKKTKGHGGIGFVILTDNEEVLLQTFENNDRRFFPLKLFAKTKTYGEMMALEYLSGKEYSVDLLMDNGEVVICVPRVRSRVSTGIVIEGIVEKNEQLITISIEIAKKLIHSGFINLQYIVNNDSVKLIDLNARFCGSQVHSMGAGVNFPYLLLQRKLMGIKEQITPIWNTRMIRYWESVFFHD